MSKFVDINGVQAIWNKSKQSFINVEEAITNSEINEICADLIDEGSEMSSTTQEYINNVASGKVDKVAGKSLVSDTLISDIQDATSEVIPRAYIDLLRRIENLESILVSGEVYGGDVKVKAIDGMEIKKLGCPLVMIGTGAPTRIPDFIGQFYINTSGPALYYSVGTDSTSNWKQA